MTRKINLNPIVKTLIISSIFCILGIFFIDKSLALLLHELHIDSFTPLRIFSEYTPIVILGILIITIIINKNWSSLYKLSISVYIFICLEISVLCKTGLKIIFGRYWPQTWINHNLSLIHDNVYGFNWFNGFANQGSFPSGHSTWIAFCAVWLYLLHPKRYQIWIGVASVGVVSQILLNYHFFGDCCAGTTLGGTVSLLSYYGTTIYSKKQYKKQL